MKVHIGPYVGRCQIYGLEKWLLEKRHKKRYFLVKESELTEFDRKAEIVFDSIQWVLNNTINKWYYDRKKRKVKIRIDNYDVWSADYTLALIIHPILLRLQAEKHGAPNVDDEDVPEHLRSTNAPSKENEWDTDEFHFLRWDWVLNEMIHAFECAIDDEWEDQFHSGVSDYTYKESDILYDGEKTFQLEHGPNHTHVFDKEGYDKAWERRKNGLRLFGKYYHALWD